MTKYFCMIKDADGNACPLMNNGHVGLFASPEMIEICISTENIKVSFGYEIFEWETFGD